MMNRCRPSESKRHGMTLVELVIAIALSAMLLTALVGVLKGVSRQSNLAESLDRPSWPATFLDLLRRDLRAAEAIWAEEGVIWIETDAPKYGAGEGVRTVGFACIEIDSGQRLLTRHDEGTSRALAIGPSRLIIERVDRSGSTHPLPPAPGPVPPQLRVWLWQGDHSEPVLLRDVVIR